MKVHLPPSHTRFCMSIFGVGTVGCGKLGLLFG
jgi:hypothetical protein